MVILDQTGQSECNAGLNTADGPYSHDNGSIFMALNDVSDAKACVSLFSFLCNLSCYGVQIQVAFISVVCQQIFGRLAAAEKTELGPIFCSDCSNF